jgi:threonine/homoserine/homoserine lactone efflux protein
MDLLALVPFALALLLNAGTPGPSIAALVSRVITDGWRDVAPFLAALWVGELLWLTCSMAGLTALAETFYVGFAALKWLGIAYLLWLAWKMWTRRVDDVATEAMPRRGGAWSMFGAGMALTLGNPKIMVFYLALLPSLVDVSSFHLGYWAVVCGVALAVLVTVDVTWVVVADRVRHVIRTPRALRIANRVSAGAMTGAAIAIATRR